MNKTATWICAGVVAGFVSTGCGVDAASEATSDHVASPIEALPTPDVATKAASIPYAGFCYLSSTLRFIRDDEALTCTAMVECSAKFKSMSPTVAGRVLAADCDEKLKTTCEGAFETYRVPAQGGGFTGDATFKLSDSAESCADGFNRVAGAQVRTADLPAICATGNAQAAGKVRALTDEPGNIVMDCPLPATTTTATPIASACSQPVLPTTVPVCGGATLAVKGWTLLAPSKALDGKSATFTCQWVESCTATVGPWDKVNEVVSDKEVVMCAIVKNQRVWEQAPVPCTEDLAAEATRASDQGRQVLATTRWFEGMQAPIWGSSVFTRTVSYDDALTEAAADCNQRSLNATDQQKLCNRTLSAALTVDAMPKTMGACCYIPVPAATLAQ